MQAFSAQDATAVAEEAAAAWQDIISGAWPFAALCEQLCVDILSPVWEVRHGAAVAMREILRSQAASAGVIAPLQDEPSGVANGEALFCAHSMSQACPSSLRYAA